MAKPPAIPAGHVRLILTRKPIFYLDIPMEVVQALCLKPRKYLIYLGWCILGLEGYLTKDDHDEIEMERDGPLEARATYYYVSRSPRGVMRKAIDLEVIQKRASVPSTSLSTRDTFRNALSQRDHCCVFSGTEVEFSIGTHIIPYARGSEWLQLIIKNRPKHGEQLGNLRDINDVRNGFIASASIHVVFDQRTVVVLKTPNFALETTDIPLRIDRPDGLHDEDEYPDGERYTLQWLKTPTASSATSIARNNVDAAFKRNTGVRKPSALLLHYNYGAAAVKQWGSNKELFKRNRADRRPAVRATASPGPSRTIHKRQDTINKRNPPQQAGAGGNGVVGDAPGGLQDSEEWDADDLILFFWSNTDAAKERRQKEEEEHADQVEKWRQAVPSISV